MRIGQVGEITVAGPSATDSYFNRDAATKLAKIRETLPDGSERIVHRMGDLGYFDSEGLLWFCGRKTQRVVVDAITTLCTEQVEPVFNTHPAIARSALVGIGPKGVQHAVLCYELKPGIGRVRRERHDELARHRQAVPAYRTHQCIPALPETIPGRHPPQRQDQSRGACCVGSKAVEGHPMKILVTGGGGFLGQALCRGLIERGHEVTSFNRGHYPALDALGVRQIAGDLADRDAVLAAFTGIDAVFHNAAKAGAWGSYESYHRANVIGTRERARCLPRARHRQTGLHLHAQRDASRDQSG